MPSIGQTVARNSLWSMGGQIALKLLSFGFTILVVRQLGDHDYGLYSTVLAFVGIFSVFADGGIAGYGVRAIAEDRSRAADLFSDMVPLRVVLSLLVLAGNVLGAWLLGYSAQLIGLIALASVGLLLYAVQGPLQVVLQGYERIDLATGANVLSQALFIAVGGLLLWLGWGIGGVIVASFCGVIGSAALIWRHAGRLAPLRWRLAPQRWLPLLRAGLPFGLITFTTMLSFKIDTILLSLWRTPAEVGWYNVAYNLIWTLLIVATGFNSVLVPSLSRHYQADPGSVHQFYLGALRLLWCSALPIAVGGTLLADRLIVWLYGAAYAPAGDALRILIWVLPVLTLTSLCGAITTVFRREHATARISVINAGFNLALNLWAIPRYGLIGAAVMTVATELLGLAQFMWLLRDTFPLRAMGRMLRAPVLAVLVMSSALLLAGQLPLLLLIALGAAIYGGCLVASGGVALAELRGVAATITGPLRRRAPTAN